MPIKETDLSRFITIRNRKDFAAGLLYIVFGAAFAIGATNYNMGSAARMGPAYFPFWLGLLLVAVGIMVVIPSLRTRTPMEAMPRFDLKTLAWIIFPVVLFGLLLTRLGLVVALVVLVLVASRASHEFKWKGAIFNAAVLLVACLGAFVYGLGLQLPLWPSFIG